MLRARLAIRSPLLSLAAILLAPACLTAQHPILTGTPSQSTLSYLLSNNSSSSSNAMLACYFAVEEDGGTGSLSNIVKRSVGAIAPYSSSNPSNPVFSIPNADTTTANAIPSAEFHVPPGIIVNALTEVDWDHYGEYTMSFTGATNWDAQFLGGDNSANALQWPSFVPVTSPPSPSTEFGINALATALVARQVAYANNVSVTDPTVQTMAESIVSSCMNAGYLVSFSAVLVEIIQNPNATNPLPKIKLSESHRITLRLPTTSGGSQTEDLPFHWNYVFPVHGQSKIVVELPFAPAPGLYQMFLPVGNVHEAVDATLIYYGSRVFLKANAPTGVGTGQFALWNATTTSYISMFGPDGISTLTNWTYYAPHATVFVPFPMLPW